MKHSGLKILFSLSLVGALFIFHQNTKADGSPIIIVNDFGDSGTPSTCTLRQAIQTINSRSGVGSCPYAVGVSRIQLDAGTYVLAGASGEDSNVSGDFDISREMQINGDSAGGTIIDADSIDRIFDMRMGANLTLYDLTIKRGNSGADVGGAIINDSSGNLVLQNVKFIDNVSGRTGGAIYQHVNNLEIQRSSFIRNQAPNAGAVYALNAIVNVQSSTFDRNIASTTHGGGIYLNDSLLVVDNSTFTLNQAEDGAGIYGMGPPSPDPIGFVIRNSTLSGNKARGSGGGIYADFVSLLIYNSTIVRNIADQDEDENGHAGGVYSVQGGTVLFRNSIITQNTDNSPTTVYPNCRKITGSGLTTAVVPILVAGKNVIEDMAGCVVDNAGLVLRADPLLSSLADHGGQTLTHALLTGSSAINAVPPGECTDGISPVTLDQRGIARPQPVGGPCDIGAVEFIDTDIPATGGVSGSGASSGSGGASGSGGSSGSGGVSGSGGASGTGGASGSGGASGTGGSSGTGGGGPAGGISGISGSDGSSGTSGGGVTPGEGPGASSSGGCSCHVTPEMY